MEVRDPIHGEIILQAPEVALLQHPVCQRLRFIKQLGLSEYSFPGATHSRYLHSIGTCHLAEQAFDNVFKSYRFKNPQTRARWLRCLRAAAMLHDVGHGPLSHTIESAMPLLKDLKLSTYQKHKNYSVCPKPRSNTRATHEDYSIKFITDSSLTPLLREVYADMDPLHIACLIDRSLFCEDDFFKDNGWDFQILLSQIISSEIDVDRMDYLARDAYYCGVKYGANESAWVLRNLTHHGVEDAMHLALNKKGIYAFDDMLLSRHHIHLTVYFHHKSVIYEELLGRYLASKDCDFVIPSLIEDYIHCTDQSLYQNLMRSPNAWAQRISKQKPFVVAFEMHTQKHDDTAETLAQNLRQQENLEVILANSEHRLSRYHHTPEVEHSTPLFTLDEYLPPTLRACPIEQSTEIFKRYQDKLRIERIYVAPEHLERARAFVQSRLKETQNKVLKTHTPIQHESVKL